MQQFLRSHLRFRGVHIPFLQVRCLLPPAATYPTSHTYSTLSPEANTVVSPSLALELWTFGGTLHPPAGQIGGKEKKQYSDINLLSCGAKTAQLAIQKKNKHYFFRQVSVWFYQAGADTEEEEAATFHWSHM